MARVGAAAMPRVRVDLRAGLAVAAAHHWLRLQAWDVAVTERRIELLGPNVGGDVTLPQLADGRIIRDVALEVLMAPAMAAAPLPPRPPSC